MSDEVMAGARERAYQKVSVGELDEACVLFQEAAAEHPDEPERWLELAAAERGAGRLAEAVEHYHRAAELYERRGASGGAAAGPELISIYESLGATHEALEEHGAALAAYRRAAEVDPRAASPLASSASLLARTGALEEAQRAAADYCKRAVSLTAEKPNIQRVRTFQRHLAAAGSVDGAQLLAATREAYVRSFAESVEKLPEGVRLELEPFKRGPEGAPEPIIPDPLRPFARVRFDAIDPASGERWMIQEVPTYGFPSDCPAASEAWFSIRLATPTPFAVLLSTRTAWDYFFLRLRFVNGLGSETLLRTETALANWYLRGFSGHFAEGGRGFFHFISRPFVAGGASAGDLRYELDLGLATTDAIGGLFEALVELHAHEPLEVVALGDAALPARG